jgi:alpha-ketoglutarate-dependent taurine dioxygenase
MGYASITVTPVTPRIGANVEGVTLSKPLSNCQVEELHQALAKHQVLFFRDQPLDVDAHKRFGRYFGELHIPPQDVWTGGTSRDLADPRRCRIQTHQWGVLAFGCLL